ncbi:MAG: MMPL family transporter, partial [Tissierellaceae bacterium]
RFLKATENIVMKLAPIIVLVSLGLAALGIMADTKVGVETDIETFMPQDMDALHDIHYIRDIVGSTNQMVIFMEDKNLLSEENLKWMRDMVDELDHRFSDQVVDIKFIDNLVENFSEEEDISFTDYMDIVRDDIPEAQRKMFINDQMNKGVILMNVEHMATEDLQQFVRDIDAMLKDAPINTSITGKSVLDVEMVKGLTDGRLKMTIIGLGLVFLVLLILYRSFFKALVAVLPVILIVGMSGGVMYLLGLKYTPITATLGALVLGMGTEMTIMLLERYLEERHLGKEKRAALLTTVKYIGKATLASGLTTVGGFSVLMTSKFVILKDFGLMTVINISLALIATFVILPALLWILDKFIVKEKAKEKSYKVIPQE